MQFQKSLMTAALLTVGTLTAVSANAASPATSSFKVNLTITSACIVDATASGKDLNFGSVAAGTPFATVTKATNAAAISISCSLGAPYVVNLTPTNTGTTGTGAGNMEHTTLADTVGYQLTKTVSGTDNWGNGGTVMAGVATPGNGVSGVGVGLATKVDFPVFAQLTTTTDVRPGDYSDTVNVSVVY